MNENLKNDDVDPQRTKTTQGCENLDEIKLDNNENKTSEKKKSHSGGRKSIY